MLNDASGFGDGASAFMVEHTGAENVNNRTDNGCSRLQGMIWF